MRIAQTTPAPIQAPDLETILDVTGGGRRWAPYRRWLAPLLVVLALLAGAYTWSRWSNQPVSPVYRTEVIARGDLTVSVSATGNVQPTNQVDVGSELSGIVDKVLVEENDRVRRNQVLALLDASKLEDTIAKSRGALAQAQAQVQQAAATAHEKQLAYDRLKGIASLSHGGIPSKSDLDAAAADLQRAVAGQAVAQAAVVQAGAQLRSDRTNLDKASLRSPIDGVVLARKIEPGQTVAASLQAPVLFTLAEDLAQMQIEVDVDEADVGQVHEGQQATFTVDAYPARRYPARIARVDYGSQVKQEVVSYLTVLTVDNDDLSLRPGMTATAEIVTQEVKDALLVPASALRFAPPETSAPGTTTGGGLTSMLVPHLPRAATQGKPAAVASRVFVLRDGQPVAVAVKTGASDGRFTQILDGALEPGQPVVTELAGAVR